MSGDPIKVSPKILTVITNLLTPKTKCQVKSFFGILNFVRRFISDFAMYCSPPFNLLKIIFFNCSKQCNDPFEMLKEMIVSHPIFIPFSLEKTSYVFIDSCYESLGVLFQDKDVTSYWILLSPYNSEGKLCLCCI